MKCAAIDWGNFLRVDDQGNEIIIAVKSSDQIDNVKPLYINDIPEEKPSKDRMLELLDDLIKSYESLPPNAMNTPVSHYDLLSALILLSSILRS